MLAFLGAIICIIASIAPASTGAFQGTEQGPAAANAVVGVGVGVGGDDGRGSDIQGTATSTATGMDSPAVKASVLDAQLGQGSPMGSGVHLGSTSRFLCLPLTQDCPSSSAREDLLLLRTTADHLSQMVTQQKDQIFNDQETIKQLTGKLNQCENGLEPGYFQGNQEEYAWDVAGDNLDHLADDEDDEDKSGRTVQELEEAIHTLRDRIEKLEVQEMEVQLLSRLAELERDRLRLQNESSNQRRHLESQLNTLHHRVTGLEKDALASKLTEGYKVSFPTRTNYMYAKLSRSLPEMSAFTVCLWLRSEASAGIGTPFSYAVPGQPNEMVLLEWGNNPLELLINNKVARLPLQVKDGRWHHVCVTWAARDGTWEAYQDGRRWGTGENLAAWHTIKPGGTLIFGQEQDVLGGHFDATQAFVGELAQFNLWDRVLTSAEIVGLANCSEDTEGHILPWEDWGVELHGGVTKWPLESCDERRRLGSD